MTAIAAGQAALHHPHLVLATAGAGRTGAARQPRSATTPVVVRKTPVEAPVSVEADPEAQLEPALEPPPARGGRGLLFGIELDSTLPRFRLCL